MNRKTLKFLRGFSIFVLLGIILLPAASATAQSLYKALPLMGTDPRLASRMAASCDPDSSEYAVYERFLRMYIILNDTSLSQTDFTLDVLSQKGKEVSTSISKATVIKFGKRTVEYTINYKTGASLHITADLKKKIPEYDTANYLTFSGKLAKIKKEGTQYEMQLTDATYKVVGGPATLNKKEWDKVTKQVKDGNWPEAAALSKEYMDRFLVDNKGSQAYLRYMYIFSMAGMVINNQMSFEELEQKIPELKGNKVMMPNRGVESAQARLMTNTTVVAPDSLNYAMTASSASSGSHIHCFEYVYIEDADMLKRYIGLVAYTGGRIKQIEVNPRHTRDWVLKLYVDPGFIQVN